MNKASQKRNKAQTRYLINIAKTDPNAFSLKWDQRIDSWLEEIALATKVWDTGGDAAHARIFHIVDRAMMTLAACGSKMWEQHAATTYSELTHACTARIAGIVDPRLYRLSNLAAFDSYKKRGRGELN